MQTLTPDSVMELPTSRLEELFPLAEFFWKEGSLPGKFDPAVWLGTWHRFVDSGIGVVLGLEKDNRIIGALGAIKYPDPNDGAIIATELFWFVHPNHRGGGVLLLDRFEQWAAKSGCQRATMVHLENSMPKVLGRFYRLRGYRPIETHYLKEI
jgi:GNAT superfamily N-acetyltransferase